MIIQKKKGLLYRGFLCLLGIGSLLASVALVDVFEQNAFWSSSVLNLVLIHIAVFLCPIFQKNLKKQE